MKWRLISFYLKQFQSMKRQKKEPEWLLTLRKYYKRPKKVVYISESDSSNEQETPTKKTQVCRRESPNSESNKNNAKTVTNESKSTTDCSNTAEDLAQPFSSTDSRKSELKKLCRRTKLNLWNFEIQYWKMSKGETLLTLMKSSVHLL